MSKGTASMGKKSGKTSHVPCRRCGFHSYHIRQNVCAKCGYGRSSKLRSFSWQKKSLTKRRAY